MKNGIKGKLGAKLVAIFLFVISAVVLAASVLALVYLIEEDSFFDNGHQLSDDIRQFCLRNELNSMAADISHFEPLGSPAYLSAVSEEEIEEETPQYTWQPAADSELVMDNSKEETETSKFQTTKNLPISSEDFYDAAGQLDHAYPKNESNISISVYNSAGELVYNNFELKSPYLTQSTTVSLERFASSGTPVSVQFATESERRKFVESCMQNGYLDYNEELISVQDADPESCIYKLTGVYTEKYNDELTISCSIPYALTAHDDIYLRVSKMETLAGMRYVIIVIALASLLFLIASFIFVICSAGYSDRFEGLHLSLFDKAPFELHLICTALLAGAAIWIYYELVYYSLEVWMVLAIVLAMVAAAALAFIILIYTISARCKAGKLFHYTIIFGSVILLFRGIRYFFANLKYSWKVVLVFAAASIYDLFFVAMIMSFQSELAIAMWLLGKLILGTALIIYAIGLGRIKEGCKKISEGKTDFVLNNTYLPPDLKSLATDINSIGNGIQLAVDERTKSERLKTELITNVSHDLKTPLTSIVNYVDILSKEDIKPDTAKEYVGVLVRQSQRMKKLIDDLVEASKASSGAIAVNAQRLDMSLLITQAVTEFDERLEKSRLTPITSLPDEPVRVMVDGRLMWRVFDNLLGNICKYAQPETRVYISETIIGDKVIVTFKNISRYALNISSDELMERFVRGDSSRHTEGSGLGLSIARSLCNLQKVGFSIAIDGDLYKAQLTFDRLPNLPEDTQPDEPQPEEVKQEDTSKDDPPASAVKPAPAPIEQPAPAAEAANLSAVNEDAKTPALNPPEIGSEELPKTEKQ